MKLKQGVTNRSSPWTEWEQHPRIPENLRKPGGCGPRHRFWPIQIPAMKSPKHCFNWYQRNRILDIVFSRQFKTSLKIRIPKFWACFWRFWQMVWVIFDIGWVSRGEYKDMLSLTTVISIRCKISFPSIEFEILPLDQAEQLLKAINHDFKWTKSHDHSHVSHVDDHMIITWHHQQCTNFEKHFSIRWKMKFLWIF